MGDEEGIVAADEEDASDMVVAARGVVADVAGASDMVVASRGVVVDEDGGLGTGNQEPRRGRCPG